MDSWKEIAAYLNRDVTTVQRWEKREGMPVHRHLHDKRGSVYALIPELDAWRQSRKFEVEEQPLEQIVPEPSKDVEGYRKQIVPTLRLWLVLASAAVVVAVLAYIGLRTRSGDATRPQIKSLAVLPFQNLSGDPAQDYFADGMTEELIGQLSAMHGLRVISRTSSMHFKDTRLSIPEIAGTLGVDAIVEGSLVREGSQVRVHAQLIRARGDEHIWAGEYQQDYRSILEVEQEVARSIVSQVEINLRPEERARLASTYAVNPEAYEYYLKGRYYFSQRTGDALNKSIASFQQAVSKDSGYAPAYGGLSESYAMLGFRGGLPSKEALTRAKMAAQQAIALEAAFAEAHACLAFIAETYEWDWPTAEREYKLALGFNPGDAQAHNWYAGYLTYVGRYDEGVSEAMLARELDPLSLPINNALAGRFLASGRYDEALRQIQQTLELDAHFAPAHQTLGWIDLHYGKDDEAIQEFKSALDLSGTGDNDLQLDLGFAYAVSGKPDQARVILTKLKALQRSGAIPSGSVAILYGALGESNEAFAWLQKAYEERDPQLTYIKAGRRFEPLRTDPRFAQFVHRMRLPD